MPTVSASPAPALGLCSIDASPAQPAHELRLSDAGGVERVRDLEAAGLYQLEVRLARLGVHELAQLENRPLEVLRQGVEDRRRFVE